MSHDATKALMGSTRSSVKEVSSYKGTIAAGVAARLKSDGTITTAKADGELLGISLGKDLSDAGYMAVCRKGLKVPVQLKVGFDPTIGAVVSIDDTSGLATGDGTRTAVNAVFVTGRLGALETGGISEQGGADVGVALIDFPGGL